jgi:hypothetical protein
MGLVGVGVDQWEEERAGVPLWELYPLVALRSSAHPCFPAPLSELRIDVVFKIRTLPQGGAAMSETRFTPGPWRVEHADGNCHIRDAAGNSLMCDEPYYPWVPKEQGDWYLIAAAPELFEALKHLVEKCRVYGGPSGGKMYLSRAKAALAKAVQP